MSTGSPARRAAPIVIAAVLSLFLAIFLFWLLSPGDPVSTPSGRDVVDQRRKAKSKLRVVKADARPEAPTWLPLEEDPSIPVVTETCKWIVTDERRNVPQWVMLDNLRDRAQLFVEDDVRCLTAAGVTPAILDFAERYQDQNKIEGPKTKPLPKRRQDIGNP